MGSLRVFLTVWIGQVASYTGSGLTSFALGVWAYQKTGSITQMTLISAFAVVPTVLLSPLAGAYVDRWDRRWLLIISDAGAGVCTLAIALLLVAGRLDLWHVYVAVFVSSIASTFRWPALSASTTQLVPKAQFGRASGLLQIVQVGQVLIAPALAGVLMVKIGLWGILLIDVSTFVVGLVTLFLVRIPRPQWTEDPGARKGSILQETVYGWTYIRERNGLFALLLYGFAVSLCIDMGSLLLVPYILGIASSSALGTTLSIAGVGFLVGGAGMSAWGGPRRPISGVIGFPLLAGVFMALIGVQSTVNGITACLFGVLTCLPLFYACNQTIWLRKVAADVQGRVFAIRRTIIMSSRLLAALLVGPLADRVFEPLLRPQGALAGSVGRITGVGTGRGMSLLFILLGGLIALISVLALRYPKLRLIDTLLADATGEPAAPRVA